MSWWSWFLRQLAKQKQKEEKRKLPSVAQVAGFSAGAFLALVAVTLAKRAAARAPKPPALIALSAVLSLLRERRVQDLMYGDGGSIMLLLKPEQVAASALVAASAAQAGARYVSQLVPGSEATLFELADRCGTRTRYVAPARGLAQVISLLLPAVFLFVWYKIAKSLISRDEKFTPTRNDRTLRVDTKFADVVSRSKIELAEIVDYLNKPERYIKAGARLPRGALLVGPSGTGKTLLARAVAGEANCNFLSASASEFVEVFVGRGAARVRDLFKQARSMAPVVLFLDELDALGTRSRGSSAGGGEEYVQTLNQLLTELDGFHGQSDGVVVLGATNRQEAIDPSLLRPGRFDRHVQVELPDEGERLEILRIHARKADLLENTQAGILQSVASGSEGFSGAELANVVNEAIFMALRSGRQRPAREDFSMALERRKAWAAHEDQALGAGQIVVLCSCVPGAVYPAAIHVPQKQLVGHSDQALETVSSYPAPAVFFSEDAMGGDADMMAAAVTPEKTGLITLRGSTDTVVEFFGYAISSILYQRGVYPPENFTSVSKYGLSILVTKDKGLQEYLGEVLRQLKGWMSCCQVHKIVVVVASQITEQTLERWAFDVQVNEQAAAAIAVPQTQADMVRQQKEIQAIIRQITASVTFLPLLDEPCAFDLLIYTDRDAQVPTAWAESDPKYIVGGQQEVKLRSFTTKIHKVDGAVAYRYNEAGA
ncbi:unnamed protein product [Polarella glacialis]|uniref:HORMA domain-containing protein n=1 Tax=Polarella glacialis TaxID=89957 RepID=A0A813F4K0_POLGL|nr:unnamed protein product [Polarella glacialis]